MSINFSCMNISDMERQLYSNMINAAAINVKVPEPVYPDDLANTCCSTMRKKMYRILGTDKILNKDEVPVIDIFTWAQNNGLEIDGKTLTCYKVVDKTKGGVYTSFHDPTFVYKIGEFVSANILNRDHMDECTNGLHGASLREAYEYASTRKMLGKKFAYLELKVDISYPDNYVIPYTDMYGGWSRDPFVHDIKPSKKIRFLKCFVAREVRFKIVAKDLDTAEEYNW